MCHYSENFYGNGVMANANSSPIPDRELDKSIEVMKIKPTESASSSSASFEDLLAGQLISSKSSLLLMKEANDNTNIEHTKNNISIPVLSSSSKTNSTSLSSPTSSLDTSNSNNDGLLVSSKLILQRERKLRQGRLLLVSLLENFCALYDQSPSKNKALFLSICKQLGNMGILDSEDFLDELSAVRASYKRAFRELVVQALLTLKVLFIG